MSVANEITRLINAKADIKSAIEAKGVTVGDGAIDTYAEKISEISSGGSGSYEQGYNQANLENPLYYIKNMGFSFSDRIFSEERSNVVCRVLDCQQWNMAFGQLSGIKTLKIICDTQDLSVNFQALVRQSADLELLDLREFKCYPNNISYFAYIATKLKTIKGAFNLTQCTNTTSAFAGAYALEDIRFVPNTIPTSIKFDSCRNLTHDSLMSIINGLKDLVHSEYDITDNPLSCMTHDQMTNGLDTYTITTGLTGAEGEIYLKSETTGKEVGFYYHYGMNFSEEILNTFKVGTKFVIDYDANSNEYNSFKIISTNENPTKQTLTISTTNLAKLEKTDEGLAAIAEATTEKGWELK